MTLVQDAQRDGARLAKACQVMGINVRTYYRWVSEGEVTADRRPDADRPEPANKLSPEEREAVLALCNAPEYRSRPPAFIVADQVVGPLAVIGSCRPAGAGKAPRKRNGRAEPF